MYTGNSLKAMHVSVDASLKKLRTSYIDLLYIHWWDYSTSIEEVMNGLHNLVVQGKVLYLVSSIYISAAIYVVLIERFLGRVGYPRLGRLCGKYLRQTHWQDTVRYLPRCLEYPFQGLRERHLAYGSSAGHGSCTLECTRCWQDSFRRRGRAKTSDW